MQTTATRTNARSALRNKPHRKRSRGTSRGPGQWQSLAARNRFLSSLEGCWLSPIESSVTLCSRFIIPLLLATIFFQLLAEAFERCYTCHCRQIEGLLRRRFWREIKFIHKALALDEKYDICLIHSLLFPIDDGYRLSIGSSFTSHLRQPPCLGPQPISP